MIGESRMCNKRVGEASCATAFSGSKACFRASGGKEFGLPIERRVVTWPLCREVDKVSPQASE